MKTNQSKYQNISENERLKEYCEKVNPGEVTSFKFHTNAWGLSSCNWYSENVVAHMNKLNKIDFSDTINYEHRSDL